MKFNRKARGGSRLFYLEIVQNDRGEENRHGQLHTTYTDVKDALAHTHWDRFVVTELTVNK